MDICHFTGIDVSKNTLDWAVYANKGIIWQIQSKNSPVAIRAVIKQLLALPNFQIANCVVCGEGIDHVRSAPYHPMAQGKIER